jgi:hypothetical protein
LTGIYALTQKRATETGWSAVKMNTTEVPPYTYINACPWSGVPCECDEFPFLENGGVLPKVCSDLIRATMPAMEPFRKLAKKD